MKLYLLSVQYVGDEVEIRTSRTPTAGMSIAGDLIENAGFSIVEDTSRVTVLRGRPNKVNRQFLSLLGLHGKEIFNENRV